MRVQEMTGKSLHFYEVDIAQKNKMRDIFTKVFSKFFAILSFYNINTFQHNIDCVLHLAGSKSVGQSCKTPIDYYVNNITGTTHLIQVCATCKINTQIKIISFKQVMAEFNIKKIVFSSSSTVYGNPQYLPIDENHPTGNCMSPYGRTKYLIEEILNTFYVG